MELPRVSPRELTALLRVMLGLAAWRMLSTDFSAFADLQKGVDIWTLPHFPVLDWLIHRGRPLLFDTPLKIQVLQLIVAAMFVAMIVKPHRVFCALAVGIAILFEGNAYLYRAMLYNADLPLALLLMAVCWPASWRRLFGPDNEPRAACSTLVACWMAYLGVAYLLCGLSKLAFDPWWWQNVRLDRLLAANLAWVGAEPTSWLRPTAETMQRLFARFPLFDQGAAFSTLVFELTWILAVFFPLARRVTPVCMAMAHVAIFLGSGLLFLEMTVIGLCFSSWFRPIVEGRLRLTTIRTLFGRRAPLNPSVEQPERPATGNSLPTERFSVGRLRPALAIAIGGLLAFWPSWQVAHYPPFPIYFAFGWSYRDLDEPFTVVRLGYLNRETGQVELVPHHHGGFVDFYSVTGYAWHLDNYVTNDDEASRAQSHAILKQYAAVYRSQHSNRWLLGRFALPDHLVARSRCVPAEWLRDLYIIEGRVACEGETCAIQWTTREPFHTLEAQTTVASEATRSFQ